MTFKKSILFLLLVLAFSFDVKAAEQEKTLAISVSDKTPVIVDKIISQALNAAGYKAEITTMKMSAALNYANTGQFDGFGNQSPDVGNSYKNLIRIPIELIDINMRVYVRSDSQLNVSTWADLQGQRVVSEYEAFYIESKLSTLNVTSIKRSSFSDMIKCLQLGEADVMIYPVYTNNQPYIPSTVKEIANLEQVPTYFFINKKYESIVPELTEAFNAVVESSYAEEFYSKRQTYSDGKKIILYIDSFGPETWFDDELMQGIQSVASDNIEIQTVNLASNRNDNADLRENLMENFLRANYSLRQPDVIIVSDVHAVEFVKECYFRLFQNVPVVYCGLTGETGITSGNYSKYFVDASDQLMAAEAVEQILKLFPDTENIFVVNDYLEQGRVAARIIEEQLTKYSGSINITYNENKPLIELSNEIKSLSSNTIVLIGTYITDSTTNYYSKYQVQSYLSLGVSVPIFGLSYLTDNSGVIGSLYVDKFNEGKAAATIALELANGTNISELTNKASSQFVWAFDKQLLDAWNISTSNLPKDSKIINGKQSLYNANRPLFWVLLLSISSISALLIVMIFKNFTLAKVQKSLHTTEELLQKERAVNDIKMHLENVIDTAPIIYMLADSEGKVIESNEYSYRMLGIKSGGDIDKLFYSKDAKEHIFDVIKRNDTIVDKIVELNLKKGSVDRYLLNITKSRSERAGYLIWGVNIERLEAYKDSLELIQCDLRNMIDTLPIPMAILNPQHLTLAYANNSFLTMFNLDTIGLKEQHGLLELAMEYQPSLLETIGQLGESIRGVATSRKTITTEMQFILSKSGIIDSEIICTNMMYMGEPSVLAIVQDVSAIKRQEEMLKSTAEKEKDANELKSSFIVNMSHEIRTPMNAVIGLSETQLLKQHDKETFDAFRKINYSGKILLSIINDILDFSKMEANKMDVVDEEFSLEDALSGAMLVASQHLKEKDVEMMLKMDYRLPGTLIGDRTRLWQILKNVMDNSAKFTNKGFINVYVSQSGEVENNVVNVVFTVEDTGAGMSPEQIENIFKPFEQFHQRSTTAQGTGLGMPICKQITELLGGTIDIKSRINKGTTTTVCIPFKLPEKYITIGQVVGKYKIEKKRILIVDDEASVGEIIQELLSKVNIECMYVADGISAIKAIEENKDTKFDMIILDYLLKNETGIDVADMIKENYNTENTKLLLVSAYARKLVDIDIKKAGFYDFIDKPFAPSMFVAKICEAFGIEPRKSNASTMMTFPQANILVCEDNVLNQEVATSMFAIFDIVPKIASDGSIALEMLEKEKFDIVFMDILMPVMDGHEATLKIRASNKKYRNVPIVAMTANAMKAEVDRCFDEGMNGHIPKPIEFDKLYSQLVKWLPKHIHKDSSQIIIETGTGLSIEGVKTEEALARFGGKKNKYLKALKNFANDLTGYVHFSKALENIIEMKRRIHTLKGTSGNLGVTEIYKKAMQFEVTLDEGTPSRELYEDLVRTCFDWNNRLLSSIDSKGDDSQELVKSAGNTEILKSVLASLKNNLDSFETKACEDDVVTLLSHEWDETLTKRIKSISTHIEEYDYEGAIGLIDKLM